MLHVRCRRRGWCAVLLLGAGSQTFAAGPKTAPRELRAPVFVEPGPREKSTLYSDGSEVEIQTETVWRPMCGSDTSNLTVDDLRRIAQLAKEAAAAHPWAGAAQGGVASGQDSFDLVFNLTSALPSGAFEALTAVEQYLEGQFSDPATIVINLDFGPLGPGILGGTSSAYTSLSWSAARAGLQADMDPDDTIQNFLPSGSAIPVRYNGNSSTLTNETILFVTKANYLATIGDIAGNAASMTFNSSFAWDYAPQNGINPGAYCFQSVLAHEVGHALGFTSGADFRANDMEALDLYRFQKSDGNGTDYNPDDLTEFGVTARMVDQNAPGTSDDVNSDLIAVEYQMSDGVPNQASHFTARNPGIYVMDPSLSSGETFYPDFYRSGDSAMFDAIGWDYPPTHTSCEQAWELKCNSQKTFDNSDVSNPADPPYSCGTGTSHDGTFWYRFTATATSASVSTCGSSAPDSTFAVYAGACGSLAEIACREDGGCDDGSGLSMLCVTGLTVGETYYVQMSARSAAARGLYGLEIGCSCSGSCCLPPPAGCLSFREDECADVGGSWAGPATTCVGDANGDGLDDTCEIGHVKFSQLPTSGTEDIASDIDWTDLTPNQVLADDFTADGRPIRSIRWWGSRLDPTVQPDGWFISFHEPLALAQLAEPSLGIYFCPVEKVTITPTPIPVCDPPHAVIEYEVTLADCCLLHANADSRNTLLPARDDGFFEEQCLDYEIGIQAVVGIRYDQDQGTGECIETLTGKADEGDFWGWHATAYERGGHPAYAGSTTMAGGDWLFGPWDPVIPVCSSANLAFELLTTTPDGADCNCNGVDDEQDITVGTSTDCNANGVPDECEPDCNANGAPDDCDITQGSSQDCQPNTVPDECDLFSGSSVDSNNNTIPDECCESVNPPHAEPAETRKNRFVSVQGDNPGRITALRVKLTSLQHPDPPNPPDSAPRDFSTFEGKYRWVGPPLSYRDGLNPEPTFMAAPLRCAPFYMDWTTVGLVHVYGAEIIPSSLYQVQEIDRECDRSVESNYSTELPLATSRWGDVEAPFSPPSTGEQPDGLDGCSPRLWRSGGFAIPVAVPLVVVEQAAKSGDGVGVGDEPAGSAVFESSSDHRFANAFHQAASDRQAAS